MNYKILTTVSAVALLALVPVAKAEDVNSASQTRVEASTGIDLNTPKIDHNAAAKADANTKKVDAKINTQAEMRTGAQSGEKSDRVDVELDSKTTGNTVAEDVKQGWENTKEAATSTMDRVEYTLFGKEPKGVRATIANTATASTMLNQPVVNSKLERVGTLSDIIVDSKGNAKLAIVSDGDFLNIGKEAAFDYSNILRMNADGDLVTPLTEESITKAQKFSYDTKETGKDVRTIPAGGYSIDKLLDADVINTKGEKVASVDNITFRNGKADSLIVGFDKTLGMGGEKAALSFSNVKMISKEDGKVDLQLTDAQAAQFETFKNSTSN